MRTLQLLRRDIARANPHEVAALANINLKTVTRIRDNAKYFPRLDLAEKVSSALDCVQLAPLAAPEQAEAKA